MYRLAFIGLTVLIFGFGVAAGTAIGSASSSTATHVGDVNCDGSVTSVDALQILRHVAGLSVNQQPSCTPIGDEVAVGDSEWTATCVTRIATITDTPNSDCADLWDGILPTGTCVATIEHASTTPNLDCFDLLGGELPYGICVETIEHASDTPSSDCTDMIDGLNPYGICHRAVVDLDLSPYPAIECSSW